MSRLGRAARPETDRGSHRRSEGIAATAGRPTHLCSSGRRFGCCDIPCYAMEPHVSIPSLFFADFAGVYDNKLCVAGGVFDWYPVPTLPAHVAVYLVALLDMQGRATGDSFGLGLCVA